jgi:hypothetical protein
MGLVDLGYSEGTIDSMVPRMPALLKLLGKYRARGVTVERFISALRSLGEPAATNEVVKDLVGRPAKEVLYFEDAAEIMFARLCQLVEQHSKAPVNT